MSIVALVGSNYTSTEIAGFPLQEKTLNTCYGKANYFQFPNDHECYVIFRHGFPYQHLPHHIPYLMHAELLRLLQCKTLLLTSSVGVLNATLPLFKPMLLSDLIMLDNRLPDGTICSLPNKKSLHLVFQDGPFSSLLNAQIKKKFQQENFPLHEVVYSYFSGPRTKTRSENNYFAKMGADVNSMTLGPEIILANELGIPTAGLVVGHKYSLGEKTLLNKTTLTESLIQSKNELEKWIVWFFQHITVPTFANLLYEIH